MSTEIQLCTVGDIIESEECRRVAVVEWNLETVGHPVFLCNFHSEPFQPLPEDCPRLQANRPWPYDGPEGRAKLVGKVGGLVVPLSDDPGLDTPVPAGTEPLVLPAGEFELVKAVNLVASVGVLELARRLLQAEAKLAEIGKLIRRGGEQWVRTAGVLDIIGTDEEDRSND